MHSVLAAARSSEAMFFAVAFSSLLFLGCGPERLSVRQEGPAVVLKAARAEIRVED